MATNMNGYEKLAGLMSKHAEVATFQRFEFLNTLNILFLQAELVHLEHDLRDSMREDLESGNATVPNQQDDEESIQEIEEESIQIDEGDRDSNKKIPLSRIQTKSSCKSQSSVNERIEAGRDWWYLSNLNPEESRTYEIMLRTRAKLQEYNEAILRQKEMKAQDSPNSCDVEFLRRWFADKKMGNFPLIGRDSHVWSSSEPSELISLKRRAGDDPLSSLFLSRAFIWWHRCIGHVWKKPRDEEAQYFEYADANVLRAANVVGSILSSGLLIASIVALYFAEHMIVRLGIIAAFTQVFSLTLILATNAKKVEVFAATAAFVAVLVVFVGNTSTT